MPGYIIDASCRCGFQRELRPGSSLRADRIVDHTIAYSVDENDLSTEEGEVMKSKGQRTIEDPFIPKYESGDSLEIFEYENFGKREIPQGPHLCPQCKAMSLMLHFSGNWD